jgi:hypothetical protein
MHRLARRTWILGVIALLVHQHADAQATNVHHVTGVFAGRSCRVALDRADVTDHGTSLYFAIDDEDGMIGVPGLLPGHTVKSVVCGDLLMIFEGPRGSLPTAGTYRVTKQDDAPPSGTVTVRLHGNDLGPPRTTRFWPDSLMLLDVDGVSGTVRLDRVTKDSLFGRFDIVGRHRPKQP